MPPFKGLDVLSKNEPFRDACLLKCLFLDKDISTLEQRHAFKKYIIIHVACCNPNLSAKCNYLLSCSVRVRADIKVLRPLPFKEHWSNL